MEHKSEGFGYGGRISNMRDAIGSFKRGVNVIREDLRSNEGFTVHNARRTG